MPEAARTATSGFPNGRAPTSPSPLALARFLRGLTQADVGRLAGKSEETIRRLEAGGTPQWRTAQAIARALEIDAATLFPAKDETHPGQDASRTTSAVVATDDAG